jgi:phage-related protein
VFFIVTEGELVALHGFQKKTQSTPQRELDIARVRQKEVKS